VSTGAAGQAIDSLSVTRRVAATIALAAQEYTLGVDSAGGRITLPEEVEEARLFIEQARLDVQFLPVSVRGAAHRELAAMKVLLDDLGRPDVVHARAAALTERLRGAIAEPLDVLPARPPDVERGAAVYREQCVDCHGLAGGGDGPKASEVEGPPPARLSDPEVMGDVSPIDVFRRVTVGVPGTAMPEYEDELSNDDRWAVTAYVLTLSGGSGLVHAGAERAPRQVFATVRRQVDSAVMQRSSRLVFDAYLSFEHIETEIRARQPGLASELEDAFGALRTRVDVADAAELEAIQSRLLAGLERAERVVADRGSMMSLFGQSLVLMLREGFEAILIIGALMTFLTRAGAPERKRDVVVGAWAAVGASLLTWGVVELLFQITPAQREVLEGGTMLLATAVLFYVSYWLLAKVEVARWTAFVKDKMQAAITAGSGFALGMVAFLAVYREGFETILFYKALLSSSDGFGVAPVAAGMGAGAVALVGVYLTLNYFGLRTPLRPFFSITSAILYYMAFVFAGKGIAELQAAGVVSLTPLPGAPRLAPLGIYPTVESLAAQGVLVVLAVAALVRMYHRSPIQSRTAVDASPAEARSSGGD
jgi:high-affinity iron transporter